MNELKLKKRRLLEQIERPCSLSDQERTKRAVAIIKRVVRNGKTEVQ